jgi:type VI protein secretion system component Hcp
MSTDLRVAVRFILGLSLIAFSWGPALFSPTGAHAQGRPSLAALQQQIDALQARLDARPAQASVYSGASIFLFIPGIQGDSTDSAHPLWIDTLAFGTGGGHAEGAPTFNEFVVIKQLDGATPALLAAARDNTLLSSATIEICNASLCPVVRYDLTNVKVTSVAPGTTETLTLSYTSIEETFTTSGNGGPIQSVSSGVLNVAGLGGVVKPFTTARDAFSVGSGTVDKIFVLFDSFAGDSTDSQHANWSDALSLAGGELSAPQSGAIGEILVFKSVDSATPLLFKALMQNTLLQSLTVELCEFDITQNCNVTYEFSDVRLTGIVAGGDTEEVSFTFDALTQTFRDPGGDQTFVFDHTP